MPAVSGWLTPANHAEMQLALCGLFSKKVQLPELVFRTFPTMVLRLLALISFFSFSVASCAPKITQTGKASYYADKFNGRKTASGEKFDNSGRTAAHRTLPFGTKVKVVNVKNGRSVKVRINDRGPHVQGRIIDLSKSAAKKINLIDQGVGEVKIKYKAKKK